MNAKTIAPLAVAAVLGLAAAMLARNMLANRPIQANDGESKLRTVMVANTNIGPGIEINPGMLIAAKVSQEMAPEDTFATTSELDGRVTQGPIYKGQPIIGTLLAPKGSIGGLQALVPKGMRAITVQVDEFTGVGGFLAPGCRVDVISTMQGEKQGDMISRTVVQNILVTAVGQRMTLQRETGQQEPPMRSVTMIATPEEAQAIELAGATGRPRLVLRNLGDDSMESTAITSLLDFRTDGRQPPLVVEDPFAIRTPPTIELPAQPVTVQTPTTLPSDEGFAPETGRSWTVKVIRGGAESDVHFTLPAKAETVPPLGDRRHEPITQTEQKPVAN